MENKLNCPKCNSEKVYKWGHRPKWFKGVKRLEQAYFCNQCNHQWCGSSTPNVTVGFQDTETNQELSRNSAG